jgi:hypothetical protein
MKACGIQKEFYTAADNSPELENFLAGLAKLVIANKKYRDYELKF